MLPLPGGVAAHLASPYGASKLAGEGYFSAYFHGFCVETVTGWFGNVCVDGSGRKQSVVAKFSEQAMGREFLELYGDGTQPRDFIHISDLTQAILHASPFPVLVRRCFGSRPRMRRPLAN